MNNDEEHARLATAKDCESLGRPSNPSANPVFMRVCGFSLHTGFRAHAPNEARRVHMMP